MNNRSAILNVGDTEYTYYPVTKIQGHEKLPYSLTVLLENILRLAPSDERAKEFVG